MNIGILDIETTGFRTEADCIVEIGIALLDLETGFINPIYNVLVKESHFNDSFKNAWIFGNSDLKFEDVMNAQPLDKVKLQNFFDCYPFTAYNKAFDMRFMKSRGLIIEEAECPMQIATPVCNLKGKLGKSKWPTVEEAWNYFFPDEPYKEKHRGLDDAIHEAKIVHKLFQLNHYKAPKFSYKNLSI